ncbi:SusC/RagA family TonB-linked outer membrane protein [Sphingobacterium sp. LRF_L2]|uniref:SusC/RagA family TonB-linked outer membrane protein n=1 Tax=Sphingobacterium sp. LRF_L2 TaxID=3369421 RepID=UPI003F5DB9F6
MKQKLLSFIVVLICLLQVVKAQEKPITGRITDKNGAPLAGVTVVLQDGTSATQTDQFGNYIFKVAQGKTIVFKLIGYSEKTVRIADANTYNIQLDPFDVGLDEVVVVAYGTQKKESVTGSISSVSADDIAKRPISNVMGALEGAAAGIQVNNTSGQPGSEPDIRIRGFTSINNNSTGSADNALSSNSPLYVIDGAIFGGKFSDLNPNDIESISVLKDAASAALYGSRASNGVIIVTTKKGKGGTGTVNASINQGFYSRGVKMYDRMGTTDFMETMWKGYRNSLMSTSPAAYPNAEVAGAEASNTLISDVLVANIYNLSDNELFDSNGKLSSDAKIKGTIGEDLDWFNAVERIGHRQDYNINGNQGSEKTNVYYSAGYLDEKGYVNHTDYKRFTGRLSADMKPVEWFKYGLNLGGTHQTSNTVPGSSSSSSSYVNPYYFATNIAPIYTVYQHDATTGEYVLDANGNRQYEEGTGTRAQNVGRHAIWENELNKDFTTRNTVNGQIYFDVNFLKDFTFSVKGDLNVRNNDEATYDNAIIGDGSGNNGRAGRTNYRYKNYMAQELLTWRKSFGKHGVTALLGHENSFINYNYLNLSKANQTFEGNTTLSNFTEMISMTDYQENYRTEGYFARATYGYDDKYFVESSIRSDGSSKFYKDVRWGTFWSLGGSWVVSREKFLEQYADKINSLKVRTAYGQVGNDGGAGLYAYYDLYSMEQNGGQSALYLSQNGNKSLIWETSSSFNAAVEGRFFNRFNLLVEYFDKRSGNLLFDVNSPLSAGATSTSTAVSTITSNIGSVSNHGWEISFDVDVVRKHDWRWNVGANATFLKNKVVRLAEENREEGYIPSDTKYLYKEGKSMYSFWLYSFKGVDQITGNSLYTIDPEKIDAASEAGHLVEINGTSYTTNTTYGLKDWHGSAIPNVYGSFNTSLSYKNFSLSALFTYSLGGKVYDNTYASLMSVSATPSAIHTDVLKAWDGIPNGMTETSADRIDPNGTPVVDYTLSGNNNAQSSRFLVDRSYFVIKNIALGYSVPSQYLNAIKLRTLRVNMGIENLATFTKLQGMNPQQNFTGTNSNSWITPRIVSFGVNIGL